VFFDFFFVFFRVGKNRLFPKMTFFVDQMNFSLLFTGPLFRLFFGAIRPPGRRFFACSASDMTFFGTFAHSAPAQRNERHNRPGYSVFLATFSTLFASASQVFRVCELFSAEFCTFSSFLTFRGIPHFRRIRVFWLVLVLFELFELFEILCASPHFFGKWPF